MWDHVRLCHGCICGWGSRGSSRECAASQRSSCEERGRSGWERGWYQFVISTFLLTHRYVLRLYITLSPLNNSHPKHDATSFTPAVESGLSPSICVKLGLGYYCMPMTMRPATKYASRCRNNDVYRRQHGKRPPTTSTWCLPSFQANVYLQVPRTLFYAPASSTSSHRCDGCRLHPQAT